MTDLQRPVSNNVFIMFSRFSQPCTPLIKKYYPDNRLSLAPPTVILGRWDMSHHSTITSFKMCVRVCLLSHMAFYIEGLISYHLKITLVRIRAQNGSLAVRLALSRTYTNAHTCKVSVIKLHPFSHLEPVAWERRQTAWCSARELLMPTPPPGEPPSPCAARSQNNHPAVRRPAAWFCHPNVPVHAQKLAFT